MADYLERAIGEIAYNAYHAERAPHEFLAFHELTDDEQMRWTIAACVARDAWHQDNFNTEHWKVVALHRGGGPRVLPRFTLKDTPLLAAFCFIATLICFWNVTADKEATLIVGFGVTMYFAVGFGWHVRGAMIKYDHLRKP